MMMYSLIEGLTALGAYGIVIIANTNLCNFTKNILPLENEEADALSVSFRLLIVLGITYLAGLLGYIIINSEVLIVANLKLFILIGLIFTIIVTHFELFWKINYSFIKEKNTNKRFTPIVCAFWSMVYSCFMTSPEVISATTMLPILFLPYIAKHLVPRFSHKGT